MRTLAVLVLFAFAVRAITPSGYMLAANSADAAIGVIECTGLVADETGASHKDKNGKSQAPEHAPCAFAVSAAFTAPALIGTIEAPLRIAPIDFTRTLQMQPGLGLAAPPPWATGPPLNA
jgi:hypothetical protein